MGGRTIAGESGRSRNERALRVAAQAIAWILLASDPGTARPAGEPLPTDGERSDASGDEATTAEDGEPRTFADQIVVTATRSERAVEKLPVSATVVARESIELAAPTSVDGVLRSVAGVNLPAGSSETQYPTYNTVSMRGLGGRRALVLVDGVPQNDAMFGHVDWSQVPVGSVERIEVVRGGSAALFGSAAMGGTVSVFSRPPVDGELEADLSYGTEETVRSRAGYGMRLSEAVLLGVDLGAGESDGYNRVAEGERRPVDLRSPWESRHATARVELALRPGIAGDLRAGYHSRDLGLGTAFSEIANEVADFAVRLRIDELAGGRLAWSAFHRDQQFDVANATVAAGGASARRGNAVATPSRLTGGALEWERPLGERGSRLLLGADLRRMAADSHRRNFAADGAVVSTQDSGGRQQAAGVFAQLSWKPLERLELLAALRLDDWRNEDGYDVRSNGDDRRYPDETVTELSPRLAARWEIGRGVGVRGAVYSAFGAPQLDQLYRSSSFRGQDNLPNPALEPETLDGGELGLEVAVPRFRAQLNVFSNRVEDLISDVVVYTTPSIGNQPQNIGTARSRGIELTAEGYLDERWSVELGWAQTDATTRDSPHNPGLEGKRTPLVPRSSVSISAVYRGARGVEASARASYVGEMFEDAENRLRLDPHTLVDLFAVVPLRPSLDAYAGVTNAFDETYSDGLVPIRRLGAPRQVRIGLRFRHRPPASPAASANR